MARLLTLICFSYLIEQLVLRSGGSIWLVLGKASQVRRKQPLSVFAGPPIWDATFHGPRGTVPYTVYSKCPPRYQPNNAQFPPSPCARTPADRATSADVTNHLTLSCDWLLPRLRREGGSSFVRSFVRLFVPAPPPFLFPSKALF